ncbi:MAG: manganese efflux pump MntP family protein [Sutterellaceae bacterium]|nr:manganese efflux pump MntP family protein [Sutterellaceae bacterium]
MSQLIEVFSIAVALSIDAMVVTLCWSVVQKRITLVHVLKFSLAFGIFQGIMPLTGWLAGDTISSFVSSWDHWLAFALLTYVAFNMFKEGLEDGSEEMDDETAHNNDIDWKTLATLAVATSLDALAVGFSFAMADYPIVWPSALIAGVCFVLTALSVWLGKRLGEKAAGYTNKLSFVGAAVLFAIGVKILLDHDALSFLGL